jgi:hypothetical protein
MSALSIQVPFPVFQDRDGQPLENGYVWVGVANLNPQTNPVVAYYDAALTVPAAQPLRTLNGYISRAGTPAQIYVDAANYSILVQDSKGSMVYNFPDGTGINPDACGVIYDPPFTGGVPIPVCEKLAQFVSVKDFGAVGDGVTDDTAAIQAALDSGAFTVNVPDGTYKIKNSLVLNADTAFIANQGATLIANGADLGTEVNTWQTVGSPMLKATSVENVVVQGGTWVFTQNASTAVGAIIQFNNVTNGRIEKLTGYSAGSGIYRDFIAAIWIDFSTDVTVESCKIGPFLNCTGISAFKSSKVHFLNCSSTVSGNSTYVMDDSPYGSIVGCFASNSPGSHIEVSSPECLIQGNFVDCINDVVAPFSAFGINVGHPTDASGNYSGSTTKVIGNTVYNVKSHNGILVQQTPPTTHVIVSGNTVNGIVTGTTSANGIQINAENVNVTGNQVKGCQIGINVLHTGSIVVGNDVSGNVSQGIRLEFALNVVNGNRVYDNGSGGVNPYGIHLTSSVPSRVKNNLIVGNVCYDSGSNIQRIGIELSTNIVSNLIVSNSCTGHTDADIFIASVGNMYLQNLLGDLSALTPNLALFALDNTGTPSVRNAEPAVETSGTTSITNLLDGYIGQIVTILAEHNVTVVNSASITLSGGVNFAMTSLDTLTLLRRTGRWVEVSRSVN